MPQDEGSMTRFQRELSGLKSSERLFFKSLSSSRCLQVYLHRKAGGPKHERHHVDHVPEACGALGPEESPQLGELSTEFITLNNLRYTINVLFSQTWRPLIY